MLGLLTHEPSFRQIQDVAVLAPPPCGVLSEANSRIGSLKYTVIFVGVDTCTVELRLGNGIVLPPATIVSVAGAGETGATSLLSLVSVYCVGGVGGGFGVGSVRAAVIGSLALPTASYALTNTVTGPS